MPEKKEVHDSGKERVLDYLNNLVATDSFFATKFIPDKIDSCWDYIKSEARKQAVNGCAMIDDGIVYQWARHYYLEEIWKAEEEAKAKKQQELEEVKKKNAEQVAQIKASSNIVEETKAAVKDAQISLFDFFNEQGE